MTTSQTLCNFDRWLVRFFLGLECESGIQFFYQLKRSVGIFFFRDLVGDFLPRARRLFNLFCHDAPPLREVYPRESTPPNANARYPVFVNSPSDLHLNVKTASPFLLVYAKVATDTRKAN
jgi:hypothetical protein